MRQMKQRALGNIWNIEIKNPLDGVAFLHASIRFNKNKFNDFEIAHDENIPIARKRKNGLSNIWLISKDY